MHWLRCLSYKASSRQGSICFCIRELCEEQDPSPWRNRIHWKIHSKGKRRSRTPHVCLGCTLSHPEKSKLIESFKSSGVTLLYGDLTDHESLVKAIKQVDIVISTVSGQQKQIDDQVKVIAAIKEAGNIKKIDTQFNCLNCALEMLVSVVYVAEEDVGAYTIKAVDDPRTLNKILCLRPPANVLTFNELVSLWESKIKTTLEKFYIPEDQLLKTIQESPFPANLMLAIGHSMLVKGDCTNYEIHPSFGVEGSELYPEVKYTTVDSYLNALV
ncbi:Isoflavone reductase-like [Spatholobus suberectus]|nr:Isoflavone reductase-like [Spatholobus suberectus]